MVLAIVGTLISGFQAGANIVQATAEVYGLTTLEEPLKTTPKPENVPDRVVKVYAPNINGLKTLEEPLKTTVSYLTQRWEVKGIQIHGKLGTGKTTIMQNLNNHELVAKIYDIVIWLNVSSDGPDTINERRNFSVEKLQKDVMSRLNLDYKIPVDHYRDEIKKTLKDTKYLLLLDNVKAALSLDEIGFPENWEERSSKVVFTTRFKGVWRSMTDRSVEVGLLSTKDATTMFSNILKISDSSIEMDYIHQAVKHCGRLVTAIKIVADHIKSETDEQILKDKLNALITWPRDGDDMITEIIRTIGFCCEDLTNEQRGCFYYGALYPEESKIYKDHLLDCWMAENNFVETRAHWRNLLKHLNDRNLFEEDEHKKKYVRMHKLFRLLALYNLKTDGRHICLVPSKEVSSDQQDKDCWEGKHWISLADEKYLMSFLDSPGCSKLSTLFLQGNSDFTKFPDSFNTESLRVLNLMGTRIESLPDSLEESKELAVLAISGTENISEVLSKLAELQEMLIDTKSKKETFDWQVINDFTKSVKTLRSLRLRFLNDEVVDVWEVDDVVRKFFGNQISNDAELDKLFQRYVECYRGGEPSSTIVNLLSMPDALVIAKRDDLENLQTFDTSQSAAILVENCEKIKYILGPVGILSCLEQLYLNDMEELESVTFGMFSLANFGKLKTLELRRCVLLTNIITADAMLDEKEMSTRTGQEHIVFPMLEKLVLVDMPKLESIWKDKLLQFPALTEVVISKCPAMKHFPISHKNSNELKIITIEETWWWEALQWEDEAKNHFDTIYYSVMFFSIQFLAPDSVMLFSIQFLAPESANLFL